MSGMVLTQLLNPDSGADRSVADRAADVAGQGRPENGPSRYDEVVRQQEERLEKQRARERADQRSADEAAARQKDSSAKQAVSDRPEDTPAQAANERRPDTDKAGKRQDSDDRDVATETRPVEKTAESGAAPVETAPGALQGASDSEDWAELLGLTTTMTSAEPRSVPVQGEAQARSGTQTMASLAGTGQATAGLPTAGKLFAAMLESGQGKGKPGGEMLSGMPGNSLQALADSGAGKAADTLAAQVATRLTAPELSNPQAQAASLRGADAHTLMRGYSTSVDVPVGADEWGEKVMGKLAWLTASQMQVAEIHVTPPDMGPLEVRVQVQNDQAAVTVHATTPAVREQLELHGHRLRDMLGEHGLTLEGFDVSDSPGREASDQQGDGDTDGGHGHALAGGDTQDDPGVVDSGELDLSWKGELDLYA